MLLNPSDLFLLDGIEGSGFMLDAVADDFFRLWQSVSSINVQMHHVVGLLTRVDPSDPCYRYSSR